MKIKITCESNGLMPIAELDNFQGDLKTLDDESFKKLKGSIVKYGFSFPIFVWGGNILDGHQRLKAVKSLIDEGYTLDKDLLPVDRIEAKNEKEAAEKLLLINSRYAKIDQGGFDLFVENFDLDIADLSDMLDIPEVDFSFEDEEFEGNTDPDEVPEVDETPVTKIGDIWILGDHRLMCGDSTKIEDVELLMDGQKADICYTSPPYGLGENVHCRKKYDKKVPLEKRKRDHSPYKNVYDDPASWLSLMNNWYIVSKQVTSCWAINIQLLSNNKIDLIAFINDNILNLVDIITWYKHTFAPNFHSGILSSAFEWILIFKEDDNLNKKIPYSDWHGTESNLIDLDSRKRSEYNDIHKATQTVEIPKHIISKIFNLCKSIYEPFSGSGTTIIAAQQTGRKCYAMEISPQYVDVAIKRWQDFTGKDAVLERTGETFEMIKNTVTS